MEVSLACTHLEHEGNPDETKFHDRRLKTSANTFHWISKGKKHACERIYGCFFTFLIAQVARVFMVAGEPFRARRGPANKKGTFG
eukprot:3880269-Pyramimonas_sp.AAC.1